MGLLQYYLQQQDQAAGRRQYSELLDQYRQPANPNALPLGNNPQELDQSILQQQGGFRAPGGVLADQPPPEFFMRAAGIQGYEQLAQNAQSNAAAMQRQMQQQGWESQNMTLAQKVAADAQSQRDRFSQERQVYEYETPSAYQRAQIGNAQAGLGIQQQGMDLNRAQFVAQYEPDGAGGFKARPKPMELSFDQQQKLAGERNTYQNATNALGDLSTILSAGQAPGMLIPSGQRDAFRDQYSGALRPIVQGIVMGNRTDAPGEADIKQINEFLGDITSPWQTSGTRQNRIKMLEQFIQQRNQGIERFTGPVMYQPGQSPYAKTFGFPAVEASKVGPVTPYGSK